MVKVQSPAWPALTFKVIPLTWANLQAVSIEAAFRTDANDSRCTKNPAPAFELPKRTAIFVGSKKTLLSSISLSLRVSRLQIKIMCERFSGEYLQVWHIRSVDYSPETSSQANGPSQRYTGLSLFVPF